MRDEVKCGGRRGGNEGTGRGHSLPDDDGQRTADDVPCVTFLDACDSAEFWLDRFNCQKGATG